MRFRGLVAVAAACLLGLAASVTPGQAADNAGIYEFLSSSGGGRPAARPQAQPRGAARPYVASAPYEQQPTFAPTQNMIRVQARKRPSIRKATRNQGPATAGRSSGPQSGRAFGNPANMADGGAFAPVGRGKVCVRLCDGFQYPAENAGGSDEVNEKLCQARCPDAEVRVFSVRDSGDLNAAVDRDKRAYRELVTAFSYQKERPASCSCRNPSKLGQTLSPLEDPTLRSGDTIVTDDGAKVFRGSPGLVHRERDFTDATKAGYLSASQRAALGIAPLKQFVSKTKRKDARILANEEYGPLLPGTVVPKPATAQDAGSASDPRVILASPFADAGAFGRPEEAPAPVVDPAADTGPAPAAAERKAGTVGDQAGAVGGAAVSAGTTTVAR